MTKVTHDIELTLQDTIPIKAKIIYDSHDPYAVNLHIYPGHSTVIPWVFARDLMLDAAFGAQTNERTMDVYCEREQEKFLFHLYSKEEDKYIKFSTPIKDITRFLNATIKIVPRGKETKEIDVDAELYKVFLT